MLAHARSDGLTVEAIGDDLLVYDSVERRAHSLNAVAASVWRACDGTRDAGALAAHTGLGVDAVGLALESLRECRLLTGAPAERAGPRVSRRAVIRRAALTGAGIGVAVPVIRSITAPSAALAASAPACGTGRTTSCVSFNQLCTGQSCCDAPGGAVACNGSNRCGTYCTSIRSTCSNNTQCLHGTTCSTSAPGGHCV